MSEITLYDIPSKGRCACWSLNPWKSSRIFLLLPKPPPPPPCPLLNTPQLFSPSSHEPILTSSPSRPARLVLNYKSLPYKTQWVEFPSIAPTMKSFGLDPNPSGTPYTLPAIHFPDTNTYMMDSRPIATELEKRHPSPPLHLDSEFLPKVEELVPRLMMKMAPLALAGSSAKLLNEESVRYLEKKPEAKAIMGLEGGDKAWGEAKPVIEELGKVLKGNGGGPFVLGKEVSYADFVIVGLFQMLRRADEEVWQRTMEIEPACKDLYEASAGWLQRDDY